MTNLTGGGKNHLDMTPDTWAKLTNGDTGGGVEGIEWEFVKCPIPKSSPLRIHMHGGASQYWFAATVENANRRTSKMEVCMKRLSLPEQNWDTWLSLEILKSQMLTRVQVSTNAGKSWQTATRSGKYNMWELNGTLSTTSVWVRVTSFIGTTVTVKNVALVSNKVTAGTTNYS